MNAVQINSSIFLMFLQHGSVSFVLRVHLCLIQNLTYCLGMYAVVCRFIGILLRAGHHTCSAGYRSIPGRKGLWSNWTGDSNCCFGCSNDYGLESSGGEVLQFVGVNRTRLFYRSPVMLYLLVRLGCCLGMDILKATADGRSKII